MDTLLRVFAALKANVKFQIELSTREINTGD
jgi:hypothetical protein